MTKLILSFEYGNPQELRSWYLHAVDAIKQCIQFSTTNNKHPIKMRKTKKKTNIKGNKLMASQQGVYAFKKGRGKIKVQALKLEKVLIFCTHVVRKQYYFSV